MSGNPYYYYNDPALYGGHSFPSYVMPASPSTQYYYNDPALYSGQNYPSYTLPTTSPPPPPVLSQDAIRKAVLQHPTAAKKDHTQAWIIGGLTALGVGAIAIWQRKALSHAWENVFKHEPPSVHEPKPPSSTKQVEETFEEQVSQASEKKSRSSGSSGSSPKPNPEPPPPPKSEHTTQQKPLVDEPLPTNPPEPAPSNPSPPNPQPVPPRVSEPSPPPTTRSGSPTTEPTPRSAAKVASDIVELSPEEKKLVNDYNIDKKAFCNKVENFMNLTNDSVRIHVSEIEIKFQQEKRGNYYVNDTGTLLFPSNTFRLNPMNRPSFFDCFREEDTESYWEAGREINPAIKSDKTEFELIEPARIEEGKLIKKGVIKWTE
ncbi:MAG: hypothetical protein ACK5T0_10475 [Vampirovibrionales bacterium]